MVGECPSKLGNGKNMNWVICDNCQSWYHSICIGLAPTIITSTDFHFSCCSPPKKNDVYVCHTTPFIR